MVSCLEYDEAVLPMIGTYESNIVNVDGPFIISVTADYGDNVWIEAPFDGEFWTTIYADIDNEDEEVKNIDIDFQEISPGEFISGSGIYFQNSIQLDYIISYRDVDFEYTLVGSKF